MEGEVVQLNDIFLFKQEGFDEDGKVLGEYVSTGQVPQLYENLRARGIPVDMSIFS
jgi:pilus assembly protein CpaF